MRPLLFLDVDGVLCPEAFETTPPYAVYHDAGMDSVWWMPDMVKPLRALRKHFDFVWATWWEGRAAPVVGMLYDLPWMDYIHISDQYASVEEFMDGFPRGMFDWKVPAMAKYAGDRPFAWIDDQISDEAKGWAQDRWTQEDVPTLFHRPDPRIGFRPDDCTLIEIWGESVARTVTAC
jgi:hypothetical protein